MLYDIIEFLAFIVPRILQLILEAGTRMHLIADPLAMSLYVAMSYVSASILLGVSAASLCRAVYKNNLIINRYTGKLIAQAVCLVILSVFTAAAPTTGLSLQYCAKAVGEFVTFQ